MKPLIPLLLLAACGEVVPGAPDAGVDAETVDTALEIDAPTCDDSPFVLPQPFAFSTAGALSGSSLVAIIDRSGLVGETHDCSNANTWLAGNAADNATITFDLQQTYDLSQIRIWNHGGITGGRGVRNLQASVSLDNLSYSQLPGVPLGLARATVCPVTAQTFAIPDVRARFVRIEIQSSHGSTPVGLSEIEFVGARVCE